ncbi:MAG: hypothetical protein U5O16_21370 [Rhodococcus sp. (in: high G+C Gram-positive bacteria)]|uniref:hypothetical protein n=1 Tax=Rhodococcus sp. TaxID=1831 RepID=UPI002ADB2E1B|nr:hypothetical protein [Rhodococcus sp. (in: high G+C Gram-positive bacteria)]
MADMTSADALRLAINVLRDSAESRKMPSGISLDPATADLHAEAAETLEATLSDLRDHE